MNAYKSDALVIGSGMSGLVSAAILATKGHKVTVLERDLHPGGCAASFEKGGYRFAVGATVGMGLEPGGLVRGVYDKLGLKPNYVEQNPAMKVHLEDRTLRLYTNPKDWLAELSHVFPGQAEKKLAFWDEVKRMAKIMHRTSKQFPVLPFKHLNDVWDTARAFHPGQLSLLTKLNQTVAERLERLQIIDSAHKTFIDGQLLDSMQTTSDDCAAINGALALDIYRFGCQYTVGGLSTIAEDLVSYIKSNGGEVHYATRVKTIESENGKITGLSCSRGDYEARVVISAIPLSNTVDLLNTGSEELGARAAKQAQMWGAFTLYLGVDEKSLPNEVSCFEQISNSNIEGEAANLLISTSPAWDSSRAPKGKRAITVSTHVNAEKWMDLAERREAYGEAKRSMEKQIIGQLERIFPNISKGIDICLSGSPKTFKNFTLRHGGTVGGFPQTLHHSNFRAPSHRTEIKGLYLAGDTIFPGQGILGTTVSGYNAARTATRYLKSYVPQISFSQSKQIISEEKKELVL